MAEPLAIKQAREWCEQIGSPLWPCMNESDWATLMRDVLAEYDGRVQEIATLHDRQIRLMELASRG